MTTKTKVCLQNHPKISDLIFSCLTPRVKVSSRQFMCQSSRGPVQSPEAACPFHVAPQPVLEASVVTTVCRDTCSRGTPARRKARSIQGLRERRHCWVIPTRSVPRRHAHLGTRECSQCWSGLIWSNPSGVTAAADAICPRSLWNCFSGTTFLPLKEIRQFSTAWARSSVRRAVILTESNSTPRKEILCTGESLLFSQLTQLAEVPERLLRPLWAHGETGRARRGGSCTAMPDLRTQTVGLCRRRIETWKAWRTESRSRVELCAWASETGWAAWATPPDAVQAAPTAQSTYLWWCSERE